MKPNLIIMTHGRLAAEMLRSAEMVAGRIENAFALCLTEENGILGLKAELYRLLDTMKADAPILFLVDLPGGTPCDLAVEIMRKRERTVILTGVNLMMPVEFALSAGEDLHVLAERLIVSSIGSLTAIKNLDDFK
ncbi:MAG: hypothetical protein LBT15_06825, partial [Synergistaceae bacterium]|nr:hypothetical protein [Synergistaceae bacterium]